MSERGASAYRSGTCVARVVNTYGAIWFTNILNGALVNPALLILKSTPLFKKAVAFVKNLLRMPKDDQKPIEQQLDELAEEAQIMSATILSNMTISSSFGLFTPLLLLFSSIQPMLYLAAFQMCSIMHKHTKEVAAAHEPTGFLQILVVKSWIGSTTTTMVKAVVRCASRRQCLPSLLEKCKPSHFGS